MRTTESQEAEVFITITAAGKENLLFRALLRQTIPLLRNPDSVSEAERMALLQTIHSALDEAAQEDYEPGCLLEDPWT